MGKSPGKWIKTLLFGKKSSKSYASKKFSKTPSGLESPVISEPFTVTNAKEIGLSESEMAPQSSIPAVGAVQLPVQRDAIKQGNDGSTETNDPEKRTKEKAAIKAQAAFRGYLARRAFRALRGIIRLQALVRGHLVRRQAVATLRSVQGIVKLQALIRGRKTRLSNQACTQFSEAIVLDGEHLDLFSISSMKAKFLAHSFFCKLISGTPHAMPLQMQYVEGEPNSSWNWMERWTFSHFWKPLPQPKKVVETKSRAKPGASTIETESGRPKRSVRRNFPANTDSGPTNGTIDSEKNKRNPKKLTSSPAEIVQDHPQSELEKVKRNLRKISNSVAANSEQAEREAEKPRHLRRASNTPTDIPKQEVADSAEKIDAKHEKIEKDVAVDPEIKPCSENGSKPDQHANPVLHSDSKPVKAPLVVISSNDDNLAADLHRLQGIVLDENHPLLNGEVSKEGQVCQESQRSSKRRASFSARSEYPENGLQETPKLPSYMAATESAKAKLRGQSSPRFSSDVPIAIDKNGFTRRHSLPSSINGKLSSQSPRLQKPTQVCAKGGAKNERSFSSSRDGHDKPIHVEWRR